MPFNPPGIIGGGRTISPSVDQDPFRGINDAITRSRDRVLQEKALMLGAFQSFQQGLKDGTIKDTDFKTWYDNEFQGKDPNQSQASKGGFFGMLGDVAMAPIDAIGKIGEKIFKQGELSATKEIEGVNTQRNAANGDLDLSDANSSDPLKIIANNKSKDDGEYTKYLSDKSSNLTTATDPNHQGIKKPWYSSLFDMPERKYLNPDGSIKENPHEIPYLIPEKEEPEPQEVPGWMGKIQRFLPGGKTGYTSQRGGDIPGDRTGDKNKAYLEDGEYVLNRNAVKAVGKGFLDHINNERYPRFQGGGFNAPGIIGGAQVQQPIVPREGAFDFLNKEKKEEEPTTNKTVTPDENGSTEVEGGLMKGLLGLLGSQQGGFNAPGIIGGAEIVRPKPPPEKEEEGEGGGGGMEDIAKLAASFFMQSGGAVYNNPNPYGPRPEPDPRRTNFQSGGYTGIPLLDQRKYESDLRRQNIQRSKDVNKYEKSIEGWQEQAERGPTSWARSAIDFVTPEALVSPYLSWRKGYDVKNLSDLPRAKADQMKADYRGAHLTDYALPPEGVNITPGAHAIHREFEGIPEPSTAENLSDEALKKRAQQALGNFDIHEWLQTTYGDNWWSGMPK